MDSKSIRRATREDAPVLTQIRNEARAWKIAHRDYAWGNEGDGVSEGWMRTTIDQKEVYVAELDGTPVGMFFLDLEDDERWRPQEPVAAYVHGLSVREGFNGRGLGGFMLDCCASEVRSLKRRYVRLDCPAHNKNYARCTSRLVLFAQDCGRNPVPAAMSGHCTKNSPTSVQLQDHKNLRH
ncbi:MULTISPECIES: GNAT family N-acetyltransferase [unclassified Caballeronia]|uniref:GNAT family N-acetyltransferase n=1 Tax=unclassified Caballeronia TaxID=2646786 RepID=UPI00025B9A08|nr:MULTISPECIES: GNAT family N-acetyltransferase [unclassified Caballeronia]EKS70343.1 GCN5-related N-acetyltransferase [Burkholderia sp. SJ98]MCE4546384.1 GNAT family N-acetyltransferase [Caballeronia sp. PC1]MCE4573141.1 GNAT family N-acetyltransferase [Caballeronia sp. CLC5]